MVKQVTTPTTAWVANSTNPFADQANQLGNRPTGSDYLGGEDFSTLPLSAVAEVTGGFHWNSTYTGNGIVDDPTEPGNSVISHIHRGSVDGQSWVEQRFTFDEPQQDVWVSYRVYIPANWKIRLNSPQNNKGFILLWAGEYTDTYAQTRTEMWRADDDTATLRVAYHPYNGTGTGGHDGVDSDGRTSIPAIVAVDRGTWMDLVMNVKLADRGSTNGLMNIWKNGALIASFRDLDNATDDRAPHANGVTDGYYFGYHNSGYDEDTTYLFDDFKFGKTAASINFTVPA